jgi:hypothetical protein
MRIVPGHLRQHRRAIGGAACHRADGVERFRQGKCAIATDPAPGRLHACDAAGMRGEADRTAGVRTRARKAHAARRGHTRTRRGASRPIIRVPGIERLLPIRMVLAEGAFMQVQLAEDDGAGHLQPMYRRAVELRHEVLVHAHTESRRNALSEIEILEGDRHAVQRATIASRRNFDRRTPRLNAGRFRGHEEVTVQLRIERCDPVQYGLKQIDRRQLARSERRRNLHNRLIVQRFCHGVSGRVGE